MSDYIEKSKNVPGQTQPVPGREHEMVPEPVYIRENYKGSEKRKIKYFLTGIPVFFSSCFLQGNNTKNNTNLQYASPHNSLVTNTLILNFRAQPIIPEYIQQP